MSNPLAFLQRKPTPSSASLQKFMGPTPGPVAPKAGPPKAPKWSIRKQLQAVLPSIFKRSKASKAPAPVVTAQQNVIAAITAGQPLAGSHQYQTALQTLAHPWSANDYAAALGASIPDVPAPFTDRPTAEPHAADTVAADAIDATLDWFEKQVLAPQAAPAESREAALARKKAEAVTAAKQLMADMDNNGHERSRKVQLSDGSLVSASFSQSGDIFTVQDSTAFNSKGAYGQWFSVETGTGNVRLNRVDVDDHVQPGPALDEALANIERLQGTAAATV